MRLHGSFYNAIVLAGALFSLGAGSDSSPARLINGTAVPAGQYKEVVALTFDDNTRCTGTVVGPKVVITAASCATESKNAKFSLDGQSYSTTLTISPLFAKEEHDVAVGMLDKAVTIEPANVGGTAAEGNSLTLLGYGCTKADGSGGNNGTLLMGESVVSRLNNHNMISQKKDGAVLCFGDSGGPAFQDAAGKKLLLGINSRGNLLNTNYSTRIDLPASKDFLKNFGDQNSVKICGIHENCGGGTNPAPTCLLVANPNTVNVNQPLTLQLTVQGQANAATINGTAVTPTGGSLTITPTQAGNFSATGQVTGAGGTGSCTASYEVKGTIDPPAPTCTLSAVPNKIKLGQQIILTLRTQGQVDQAYIDGQQVTPPEDSRTITPAAKGQHESKGWVVGPKGTNQCAVTYSVEDGGTQPIPDLAVIPTYCGKNTISQTEVDSVCLAVLKNVTNYREQYVSGAVQITYRDGVTETLPVIAETDTSATQRELVFYTNSVLQLNGYKVLETKNGTLTLNMVGTDKVPTALEGRSSLGHYFVVDTLTAP